MGTVASQALRYSYGKIFDESELRGQARQNFPVLPNRTYMHSLFRNAGQYQVATFTADVALPRKH